MSDHLQSNKARDLLRYVVCRLYDQGSGHLMNAQLSLAQTTVAKKLGISRQWVGTLVQRLEETGWLVHASEKLPDGTNGSTIWRFGRLLKRLLVMLTKSPSGKFRGDYAVFTTSAKWRRGERKPQLSAICVGSPSSASSSSNHKSLFLLKKFLDGL